MSILKQLLPPVKPSTMVHGERWMPGNAGLSCTALADLIEAELDAELAALETLDNGKPISDSLAADLPLIIDCLRYYAGFADNNLCTWQLFTYTKKEPVGSCGTDHSLKLPYADGRLEMGPSSAAGCTIVMKPAEQTPLTCPPHGSTCTESWRP